MGFFTNKSFNRIYAHAALQAFAMNAGEAFAFIYLLKAGVPTDQVLACIGLMFASRIILRRSVVPLVLRFGLRQMLAASVVLEAISYVILSQVTGMSLLLAAYLALWAFSSSVYWTTYHTYVTLLGNSEHRGAQVSVIESLGTIMGIVAPLIMASLLTFTTPVIAFGTVTLVMAAGAIPVLLGPDFEVARQAEIPRETRNLARLLLISDGLRSGTFHFTWIVALFITLGSSYVAFGGAMALAGLAGAATGILMGRLIDLGNGLRAAKIGYSVLAIAALARTFGYEVPFFAVLANAAAAIAWPIYNTGFASRVYNLAKKSPCPLRFTVTAEGGWDIGTATGALLAATLVHFGFSFFWPLAFALVGIALGYKVIASTFVEEKGPVRA